MDFAFSAFSQYDSDKDAAIQYARQLRQYGALVIAVGVGPALDYGLIKAIAGKDEHAFFAPTVQDLTEELASDVANITCHYWPPRKKHSHYEHAQSLQKAIFSIVSM